MSVFNHPLQIQARIHAYGIPDFRELYPNSEEFIDDEDLVENGRMRTYFHYHDRPPSWDGYGSNDGGEARYNFMMETIYQELMVHIPAQEAQLAPTEVNAVGDYGDVEDDETEPEATSHANLPVASANNTATTTATDTAYVEGSGLRRIKNGIVMKHKMLRVRGGCVKIGQHSRCVKTKGGMLSLQQLSWKSLTPEQRTALRRDNFHITAPTQDPVTFKSSLNHLLMNQVPPCDYHLHIRNKIRDKFEASGPAGVEAKAIRLAKP